MWDYVFAVRVKRVGLGLFWLDDYQISLLHEWVYIPFILRKLIEHGANPDIRETWHGNSPLHWAATKRHPDSVCVLLELGANANIENNKKETPLNHVFYDETDFLDTTMTLLKHGARLGRFAYPEDIDNWHKMKLIHHVYAIQMMVAKGKLPVDLLRYLRDLLY
jgi:hypothetical protein